MTIDTKVRRITRPGTNLFRELGFTPEDADRLHAESAQQINDTLVNMLSRVGKPVRLEIG